MAAKEPENLNTAPRARADPPTALSREQCDFYWENGWLLVEDVVSDEWIGRLRSATEKIVDDSRAMTRSSVGINLWDGHSEQSPRLYDVASPEDMQPEFWEFASQGLMVDIACDLLGPQVRQVRYRYGTLRFRELVEPDLWHQDMPYDEIDGEGVLVGIHLHDTDLTHRHLQVISGSHRGETFTHKSASGEFIGELNAEEMTRIQGMSAIDLAARAGSVELLDYRTLHQDMWGGEERGGVLLYFAYATIDAIPIGEPLYPAVPSTRRGQLLGTTDRRTRGGRPA